jgi:diacylglycerol kinase family enzyme
LLGSSCTVNSRIALVVNPVATRVGSTLQSQVIDALTPFGLDIVAPTARRGDGARLASAAVESGATLVIAMGGDGTANEVAGALAHTEVPLALIPAGSTNVFARALGWPHPARLALPVLIQAIQRPQYRHVTLGHVTFADTTRVFCVNAGTGLDADTIHLVEAHPWVKTRLRNLGVGATTLLTAARNARSPTTVAVSVDGGPSVEVSTLICACGAPYAFVGSRPLELVPGASFDGRLRWIGLRTSRLGLAGRTAVGALRGGRHLGRPDVLDGWADTSIEIHAPSPIAVQADGEPLGRHAHVRMAPGPQVRVLVPAGR